MGKSGSSKRQGLRRRITKPTGIRFESQARRASLTQSAALGEISVPVSIAALRIERGVLGVSYNGGAYAVDGTSSAYCGFESNLPNCGPPPPAAPDEPPRGGLLAVGAVYDRALRQ